jgi:glucose/arabinose dehydrogenase
MALVRIPISLLSAVWLGVLPAPVAAITLPPGFVSEAVPFTFDDPTAIAFLPNGRLLVAEKGGIVYAVDGTVRHALWSHEEEVLNTADRGLLAIAVDPASRRTAGSIFSTRSIRIRTASSSITSTIRSRD